MAQWLRADLAATTRDWIIAFFHHPTYTKGTHDSDKDSDSAGRMNDMRAISSPSSKPAASTLCSPATRTSMNAPTSSTATTARATRGKPASSNKQATAVPTGKGAYVKPRSRTAHAGEISVVTGSAGHASAKPVPLNHPAMWISLNEAGSSVVDIDGLKLEFTFLNESGQIRDTFTIEKSERRPLSPLS